MTVIVVAVLPTVVVATLTVIVIVTGDPTERFEGVLRFAWKTFADAEYCAHTGGWFASPTVAAQVLDSWAARVGAIG